MTDITSHRGAQRAARRAGVTALLLGSAIFGLLWILQIPLRDNYVLIDDDIVNLVEGSLLAPGAHWQDWFTRGESHFYDLYPDWPVRGSEANWTAFSRPAFQFTIYLAHFVLGRNWASYQLINCFAVACVGAMAFQIARTALGLRSGASLVAAILVVLSQPVWESWLLGVGFAIEPLATILVAGAFLAVLARRDFLCLVLLFLALLTKENTVWAPIAAGITIMLRPEMSLRGRAFAATAMLLPVMMWLGLRFIFFGGIGGTYATAGYTAEFAELLKVVFDKLTHLHHLFITHTLRDRGTVLLVILDLGAALLIYAMFSLWALHILLELVLRFRNAIAERVWPVFDPVFFVALWATIAFGSYLAIPMSSERYAMSAVVFAWPALVAEVERSGKAIIWFGLAVCVALSLTRSSYYLLESIAARNDGLRNNYRAMYGVLGQAPTGTRQIYVLSAGGLPSVNPQYVRSVLGVSAEIVHVVEIDWNCSQASDLVALDHSTLDGVVSMTVTVPSCANLFLKTTRFNIANGRLYRNDTMSYEFKTTTTDGWSTFVGRNMTVHIRPTGPARFIIEHGGPNGIAWFDTP